METIEFIFEIIIGICSAIGLLFIGIYIGKKFGTFKNFILKILENFKQRFE